MNGDMLDEDAVTERLRITEGELSWLVRSGELLAVRSAEGRDQFRAADVDRLAASGVPRRWTEASCFGGCG